MSNTVWNEAPTAEKNFDTICGPFPIKTALGFPHKLVWSTEKIVASIGAVFMNAETALESLLYWFVTTTTKNFYALFLTRGPVRQQPQIKKGYVVRTAAYTAVFLRRRRPAARSAFFYAAVDDWSSVRPMKPTTQSFIHSLRTRISRKNKVIALVEQCSTEGF